MSEDCPGAGKCHGCMSWCDYCGSVSLVCDAIQGECSRHHCYSCKQLLGQDDYDGESWSALCRSCSLAAVNDDLLINFEKCLARGSFVQCERIALDITINREPWRDGATDLLWALYRPIGGLLWRGPTTITRRRS